MKVLTAVLLTTLRSSGCVAFPQQFPDIRSWEAVELCGGRQEQVFKFLNGRLSGASSFLNSNQRFIDFFEVFHRILKYMQLPADS
ncbi:MAG UNVERIFIED_CONTAM: hypothetical protein LVR18_44930 [Planctomycetaceae bacterium]|jgi:hypothetical protein